MVLRQYWELELMSSNLIALFVFIQSKTFNFVMFSINYLSILLFLVFSILLSTIIYFLSFVITSKLDDAEKLTIYECGFNPFHDSRSEFNIKFYIVAILFLIFDLEISYLFPFVVCTDVISSMAFFFMFFFLFVLTIGFLYE